MTTPNKEITRHADVLGQEHISEQGVVVLPNRLSFKDVLLIESLFSDRQVTYLIEDRAVFDPLLTAHLEKEETSALVFSREDPPQQVKREIHPVLSEERVLCYVPGRAVSRDAANSSVPSETLKYLASLGAPISPLFVAHPRETRLAIEDESVHERVVFSFGRLLEKEAVTLPNYWENLLWAGVAAFETRPLFDGHLGQAVLRGLKKHGKSTTMLDGMDGSELRFDKILAAGIALSRVLRKRTSRRRVGIILPPGKGGVVANVAALLADKVPVNLNFTAGESAVKSAIKQADLDLFVTARAFQAKLKKFPWPPDDRSIHLDRELPRLKKKIVYWLLMSKVLGAGALARFLKIPAKGGKKEAVLLFTSGSSGDPKGVVLSHRNVLSNITQFGSRLDLRTGDVVLASLPLFHSFGSTVTLWYPLIEGITPVSYPNPLDAPKISDLVEKHRISLFIATPSFLRSYLRRVAPEKLASLRYVITGAEKLPRQVAEAFKGRFGIDVLEGYGLTETSPVTSVNLPDPPPAEDGVPVPVLPSSRSGSVGQVMPGMAVRVTDPETDEPLSLHHSGMLWLKGPNIFEGYLHDETRTREVLRGNWLKTGDIGRMDEDGFLYIEGRLSRFSKIAGEMVPHETVEDAVTKALGLEGESERRVAIVGAPNEAKGESLVLLSSVQPAIDLAELRKILIEKGLPNLWIPKVIGQVNEIPLLASGKLDIKSCEQAGREAAGR